MWRENSNWGKSARENRHKCSSIRRGASAKSAWIFSRAAARSRRQYRSAICGAKSISRSASRWTAFGVQVLSMQKPRPRAATQTPHHQGLPRKRGPHCRTAWTPSIRRSPNRPKYRAVTWRRAQRRAKWAESASSLHHCGRSLSSDPRMQPPAYEGLATMLVGTSNPPHELPMRISAPPPIKSNRNDKRSI